MRRIRAGVILSVGLAGASCGGSSTEPEDSLTQEEAVALLEVAMSRGLQLTNLDALPAGSETVTPDGVVLEFTVPCTMGGTVAVDALFVLPEEPVAGSFPEELAVSTTLVHSDCMERHAGTGITFTLDGAPEVEMSIGLSISTDPTDPGIELSGTVDGTVRWATDDGRSGSCRLDVALEPVDDPDALLRLSVILAGQACGAQIMESFSADLSLLS